MTTIILLMDVAIYASEYSKALKPDCWRCAVWRYKLIAVRLQCLFLRYTSVRHDINAKR